MNWRFPVALVPLLLVGACASVGARWQQLSRDYFYCVEPAGRFINYEIPPLQPERRITFRFKLLSENFDPKWTVNAAVFFDTPAGRTRLTVGKAQDDRDHIYVALQAPDAATNDWELIHQYPVSSDWIDVTTKMDLDGTIHVMSGESEGLIKLRNAHPMRMLLHCNSGAFEIGVLRSTTDDRR